MRLERGHPQVGALALPVGEAIGLQAGDRLRRRLRIEPRQRRAHRATSSARMRAACGARLRPGLRQRPLVGAEQDPLFAIAHEPGLHQQLDVVVGVGAGDVEPGGTALGALAQQELDEPIADVAGVGHAHRIELHDRPLVTHRFALDPDEPGDVALLLVDVHQVVWPERAERQPEQAEHADRRPVDRQAEGSRLGSSAAAFWCASVRPSMRP